MPVLVYVSLQDKVNSLHKRGVITGWRDTNPARNPGRRQRPPEYMIVRIADTTEAEMFKTFGSPTQTQGLRFTDGGVTRGKREVTINVRASTATREEARADRQVIKDRLALLGATVKSQRADRMVVELPEGVTARQVEEETNDVAKFVVGKRYSLPEADLLAGEANAGNPTVPEEANPPPDLVMTAAEFASKVIDG